MSSFQVIVGSMLGTSEYVAQACEEALLSLGHQVTLHFNPQLDQILTQDQTWLLCTSTHGAGDYPDNLISFVNDLEKSDQKLSSTKILTIGLGDSNYDTFCFAAKNLNNILLSKGCKELNAIKLFDAQSEIDPEEASKQWLLSIKEIL